jgi:predicted transcriptional regulator
MNTEKDQVIEMIRLLPEDSTIDDIMEELYFRMQVDRGLKELDEGISIPHQHVRDRLSKWLGK